MLIWIGLISYRILKNRLSCIGKNIILFELGEIDIELEKDYLGMD